MIQKISQVLSDFLTGFQRNPMDVQETTELHKQLFSALYRQFSDAGVKYELERSQLGMEFQPERKQVRINPVRTAYPPAEKFDIAILDVEASEAKGGTSASKSDRGGSSDSTGNATNSEQPVPNTYQVYWQQPLGFALNLHFCLEEDQIPKYLKAQQKDLRKMATYREKLPQPEKFIGISLLLVDAYLEEDPGPELNFSPAPGLTAWVVTPDVTYRHDSPSS